MVLPLLLCLLFLLLLLLATFTSVVRGYDDTTATATAIFWQFSVLVGLDSSTVKHYGGKDQTIKLLLNRMNDYLNAKFFVVEFFRT